MNEITAFANRAERLLADARREIERLTAELAKADEVIDFNSNEETERRLLAKTPMYDQRQKISVWELEARTRHKMRNHPVTTA